MIFLTGYGQMCNNMLQFGHFYAFARENNIQLIGMRFCYKYPYFNISREKNYNIFTYLFAKYGCKLGFIPKVEFNDKTEDQQEKIQLLKTNKLVLTKGWYFRQYDLFLSYRSEIRSLFAFNEKTTRAVKAFLGIENKSNIRIGIHLRRGDYNHWHEGKYYFSDEAYAQITFNFIKNEDLQQAEIFLVTNDNTFKKGVFENIVQHEVKMLNGNPGEDLCLLSNCDYIIGPPSTYSLMAAFYEDKNLYWIFNKDKQIHKNDFNKFSYWFKKII